MPNNTMTLALDGDVPFSAFAKAMSSFNSLVNSLSTERGVGGDIEWFVDALEKGSALTTIRGESEAPQKVETVIGGFAEIATALETGQPMPPFRAATVRHAQDIVGLLDTHVTSVRFETAEEEHIVTSLPVLRSVPLRPAYGAVEGRIQTLSNRHSLRFTLFDSLHDRAVSCYVVEEREDIMREAWDKRAIVEGLVTREPTTGRPLAIRRVMNVRLVPEKEGDYKDARGVVPFAEGGPTPEDLIRKLRDG